MLKVEQASCQSL